VLEVLVTPSEEMASDRSLRENLLQLHRILRGFRAYQKSDTECWSDMRWSSLLTFLSSHLLFKRVLNGCKVLNPATHQPRYFRLTWFLQRISTEYPCTHWLKNSSAWVGTAPLMTKLGSGNSQCRWFRFTTLTKDCAHL